MGTDTWTGSMALLGPVVGVLILAVTRYTSSPYTSYTSYTGETDPQGEVQYVDPQSLSPGYEYYDDIVSSPTPGYGHRTYRLLPIKDGVTGERNKRGAGCMRRCLRMQMLHPAQCNSLC